MRKLFFLLLFLATPPILVVFAFTTNNIPTTDTIYSIEDPDIVIQDELDRILQKESTGIETIKLSEDAFNNLIFNNLRTTYNELYAPPGWPCEDISCRYIIAFDESTDNLDVNGGIVAIWATFEETSFTIYIHAESTTVLALSTLLEITFSVEDTQEALIVSYDSARLGKVPIPKRLLTTIITSALSATGEDEQSSVGEGLTVNASNLEFVLDKTELTESTDIDPRIATLFLDEDIPYTIWVFLIWLALDL